MPAIHSDHIFVVATTDHCEYLLYTVLVLQELEVESDLAIFVSIFDKNDTRGQKFYFIYTILLTPSSIGPALTMLCLTDLHVFRELVAEKSGNLLLKKFFCW